MNLVLASGILLAATGMTLVAVIALRLLAYGAAGNPQGGVLAADFPREFPSGFPPSRYEAASRLLAADDFQFLAGQPGYRREIGKKFLRGRRRIFRMYVRELAIDFKRVHAGARRMIAEAPEECSVQVATLMRQQAYFWWAMFVLESRLLLPGRPQADVTPLIQAVQAVRADLNRVSARPA